MTAFNSTLPRLATLVSAIALSAACAPEQQGTTYGNCGEPGGAGDCACRDDACDGAEGANDARPDANSNTTTPDSGSSSESEPEDRDANDTGVDRSQIYDVCGTAMTGARLEELLQGSLIVSTAQSDAGLEPSKAALMFALDLALNGIDFGVLGKGGPAFVNDAYVYENGDAIVGFRFVFAEDAGAFEAGYPITHDIFSPDSFVTDIDYDVDVGWDGVSADVSFVPGPLYELIDGEIEFDGIVPTFAIRLKTELIAVQLVTEQQYSMNEPVDDDVMDVHLNTTPVRLEDLQSVLETADIGLVMTGTHYDSPYFGLEQIYTDATFMIRTLTSQNMAFTGTYEAVVDVLDAELSLYHSGSLDTVEGSFTDIFCDEERTTRLGRATHDRDLENATFTLENGDWFTYTVRGLPGLAERFE